MSSAEEIRSNPDSNTPSRRSSSTSSDMQEIIFVYPSWMTREEEKRTKTNTITYEDLCQMKEGYSVNGDCMDTLTQYVFNEVRRASDLKERKNLEEMFLLLDSNFCYHLLGDNDDEFDKSYPAFKPPNPSFVCFPIFLTSNQSEGSNQDRSHWLFAVIYLPSTSFSLNNYQPEDHNNDTEGVDAKDIGMSNDDIELWIFDSASIATDKVLIDIRDRVREWLMFMARNDHQETWLGTVRCRLMKMKVPQQKIDSHDSAFCVAKYFKCLLLNYTKFTDDYGLREGHHQGDHQVYKDLEVEESREWAVKLFEELKNMYDLLEI